MSDSLFEIYIHIVFGTYMYHIPENILPELHAYIAGLFNNHNCHDICIGGITNHVHILTSLPKKLTVPEIVKQTKTATNSFLISKFDLPKFSWQQGYAAFSVSPSEIDKVKNYIRHQKQHHAFISFDDELQKMLQRCLK